MAQMRAKSSSPVLLPQLRLGSILLEEVSLSLEQRDSIGLQQLLEGAQTYFADGKGLQNSVWTGYSWLPHGQKYTFRWGIVSLYSL